MLTNRLNHKWNFGILYSMSYKLEGENELYWKPQWDNSPTGGIVDHYCSTIITLNNTIIIYLKIENFDLPLCFILKNFKQCNLFQDL